MLWRLLLSTSSISTDCGEMRTTLYRRFTMSPSEAIKTSSPVDKKIFFVSPVRLANPKNLRLIGGGGGGGGGPCATTGCCTADATGFGISTCTWKMLRPAPSYLVSSLARNQSYRNVGSRLRGAIFSFFPLVFLTVRAA